MTVCFQSNKFKDTSAHTREHALHELTVQMCGPAPYLYVWKGHAYDEVAGPVTAACEGDGSRPRSLAEQFSHYEPWNGTGANLKETHKHENRWHANVAHPRVVILEGKRQLLERSIQRRLRVTVGDSYVNWANKNVEWAWTVHVFFAGYLMFAEKNTEIKPWQLRLKLWHLTKHTWNLRPTVMAIAQQHIPPRPTNVRTRLPALSTSATWNTQYTIHLWGLHIPPPG